FTVQKVTGAFSLAKTLYGSNISAGVKKGKRLRERVAEIGSALGEKSKSEDWFRIPHNKNSQISSGFGFNGTKPRNYANGLAHHLNRITGRKFRSDSFEISEV
ncbi:MAG: hypothetical protein ACOCZS_03140, partial [Verrucomicrobiota bacterium]